MAKYDFTKKDIFGTVTQVDVSQSGRYLFIGLDENEYCSMWDVVTQQMIKKLAHSTRVSCLQVAPDGCSVATGCWDKILRIWA